MSTTGAIIASAPPAGGGEDGALTEKRRPLRAPCPPKSTGKVVEGGKIVKCVGVETDEFPHKNILEAEAVPKGRHDDDVRATGEGVSDPMQRPVHANQPDDVMVLIAKAMEKLMDR
jgi:hypothetical protein